MRFKRTHNPGKMTVKKIPQKTLNHSPIGYYILVYRNLEVPPSMIGIKKTKTNVLLFDSDSH